MNNSITFSIGQVVPWPAAPMGFAQVADLRRTKVQLCYPFKNGRIARPTVTADALAKLQDCAPLMFALHNPFNRGVIHRQKIFQLTPPHWRAAA